MPQPIFLMMLLAVALPIMGAAITSRTYRTDAALATLPVPVTTAKASLSAILTMTTVMVLGPMAGWAPMYAMVMGTLLGLAFFTDAVGRILPDILTSAIACAGLVLSACGLAGPMLQTIICGGAVGMVALLIRMFATRYRGPEAFCLGDVKLLIASGFAISPSYLAGALVMGAPVTLLILLATPCGDRPEAASAVPFGSVFVAGLAATIAIVAATLCVSPENEFLWSLGF